MTTFRAIAFSMLFYVGANGAVFAQGPGGANEPRTLRPSDGPFETRMVPHYATWRVDRILPDGAIEPQAVWTDRFEERDADGERWLRFQTDAIYFNGRHRRDIKFWHPTTLATRSIELHDYNGVGGWAHIGYDGEVASTVFRREPDEEMQHSIERLGEVTMELGQEVLLFQALEPEVGLTYRYPAHDRIDGGIRWITTEVTGRRTLAESSFAGETGWLLENSDGYSYQLIRRPPYVITLEVNRADGAVDRWSLTDYQMFP